MFKVCIYACPSLEGGPATSAELAGILRTDVGMQCSTAAAVTATEQEVTVPKYSGRGGAVTQTKTHLI